jgi:hypothetical protein
MGLGDPGQGLPPPSSAVVTGVIDEVIQVPNYTYLRLKTSSGDEWTAVNSTPGLEKGQPATVTQASLMTDFASSTLKRTFERIWFGQLQLGASSGGGAAPSAPAAPATGGFFKPSASSATAGAMAAVQKAQGPLGLRVSDVYSERKALAGKAVRVRGLVTKVNSVQGTNYVHLKDGSGTAATVDDDLTVATKGTVKVDDVVTLEGTVVVDKDLGMGPRPVLLEDAKVVGD